MTEGEKLLIDDLNEFVRQSSDQLEEQQSTGIRPPPKIETTEQTLDTTRFGMEFSPEPLAEAAPGGGGEPPPEENCITHLSLEVCQQYGGQNCYIDIFETIEVDIEVECPLDLGTSGCKVVSNNFPLTSQVYVEHGGGCAAMEDISDAYFNFYPDCFYFDVSTGWNFTPAIVFPHYTGTGLTVLGSPVVLGFVDLIADGPFESDPSDGPCPCWVEGGGSVQCSHFVLTFS